LPLFNRRVDGTVHCTHMLGHASFSIGLRQANRQDNNVVHRDCCAPIGACSRNDLPTLYTRFLAADNDLIRSSSIPRSSIRCSMAASKECDSPPGRASCSLLSTVLTMLPMLTCGRLINTPPSLQSDLQARLAESTSQY